ncbi:MAG: energy transducer TonB [Muribaculaceae bacterium]|nr:energy transducer TonB [Muribaculaceae bacterium]
MKRLLLLVVVAMLAAFGLASYAQSETSAVPAEPAAEESVLPVKAPEAEELTPDKIYESVDEPAEFPGGTAAINKWLWSNLRYPEAAQENGVQGRVIVRFVVEKDGSIANITVLKGVDKDLDSEAVRVVKRMPNWIPGRKNGEAVRSYYIMPITFSL